MYLERLSVDGISASPYYTPGGRFNPAGKYDDTQMPNCTRYCNCRANEALDAKTPQSIARVGGGFGNAKDWWEESPLTKGYKLKNGCIAVFDGNCGHVCFVERVIDSTHALISESQYDPNKTLRNYKYWQKRIVELIPGKATLAGVGALKGFLYLDIDDIRTTRSTGEQIQIIDDFVNVRVKPEGDVVREGCFAPMGIYDVIKKKTVNGYIWYQIDANCWVRDGSWIYHYPAENNEELSRLQKENKELKEKLAAISKLANY